MARKAKKGRSPTRPKPFYELAEVKLLIQEKKVLLRGNALDEAREAFGWDSSDILSALAGLQLKHFHKSDVSKFDPLVVVDYYKAYRLKGEEIYTHFYINDTTGRLVVNSFKEI